MIRGSVGALDMVGDTTGSTLTGAIRAGRIRTVAVGGDLPTTILRMA